MPDVYEWRCACGSHGRGEKTAQEHARTCHDFGRPFTNPHVGERCQVPLAGDRRSPCGLPVPCREHGGAA